MKKVFQLVYTLNLAGTEMVFMNWYRNINRKRIQFDFGIKKPYNTPITYEIKNFGGHIYIVPFEYGFYGRLKFLWYLYKTLKKNGPYDIFQSHDYSFSGFTCMIACLAGIKKRITFSHFSDGVRKIGFLKKFKRILSRRLIFLFSTKCLAISNLTGKTLYGNNSVFTILPNGIDTEKFKFNQEVRNKVRKELNIENKFVIGHVGRFAHEKNHNLLIDIFNEIYKRDKNSVLLLIGDGLLKKKIKQKVDKLNLTDNVIFTGIKTNVNDYYQSMDVFILPSFFEGLPTVNVEAQCSGLPCFISDGVPDEVMICNTTKISLSKHAKEWAKIILENTKNFERRNCSEIIKQAGFDIKDTSKQIEKIYLEE